MDGELLGELIEVLEDLDNSEGEIEDTFDLLSDRYVRYTLRSLSEQSTASLEQLADVVAGIEAAERDAIVTPAERDRIRDRLYHVVLPKLDAHGYLRFDPTDRTVTRRDVPATVSTLLAVARALETNERTQ